MSPSSLFRLAIFVAFVFGSAAAAFAEESNPAVRTWGGEHGGKKATGILIRMEGPDITVRQDDGKEVTLGPFDLTHEDHRFLFDIRAGRSKAYEYDFRTGVVKVRSADSLPESPEERGPRARRGPRGPRGAFPDSNAPTAPKTPELKPGEGYIESESNVSVAPFLPLTAGGDWSYQAEGRPQSKPPQSKPPVTKQVRLLTAMQSMPSNFSLSVLPGSKLALVTFKAAGARLTEEQAILQVCDLTGGRVATQAKVKGETPLAISPDGKWIAMVTASESGFSKSSEIRLYQRDGSNLKRVVAWRPYVDEDETSSFQTNVAWGLFLDNNRLLTTSADGLLALWEIPEISPLWCVQLQHGSAPVISPGGKYLAMVADKKLMLIDLESTQIAGSISSDLEGARLAFRPDGRRVAGISGDRICVWDLETKETYRDFNLLASVGADETFEWLDDNHLLAGDSVVDVDRRVAIWKHVQTLARTAQDGRLSFIKSSGKDLTLASTRGVPQTAIDAVAKLKPEDLLVIGPGTEVSLEVSASGDVQSARDVLERKLKDNGFKLVSAAKVRLIGTVAPGEPHEIEVREFGARRNDPNASTKHTVTPHKVDLSFKIGERTVWRRSYTSNLPNFIDRKDGESIDQAIQRLTYLDASYLTGYSLPKCLARLPESLTK